MEAREQRQIRREMIARMTAAVLGVVLSLVAFNAYREYAAQREAATVQQLRDGVQSSRSDLMVLVPAAMELNYHAQVVWTYCLLPGRPELSRVRRRTHSSVLGTLQREEQATVSVVQRAAEVERARRVWGNTDLRSDYIQLAAMLRYQAENAGMVLDSATQTKSALAKL